MSTRFYSGVFLFTLAAISGIFLFYKNYTSGKFEGETVETVLTPIVPSVKEKILNTVDSSVKESDSPSHVGSFTLLAVGDIMLDRSVMLKTQAARDWNHPFLRIDSLFDEYDLHLANLEGPLTTNKSVSNGTGGARFTFTFSPEFVGPLKNRFEFLSLANNHTHNFGEKGLVQTRKFLSDGGIKYFGGPDNVAGTISVTSSYNGITFAFVGYHQLVEKGFENVVAEVKRLDSQVDLVIVMPHWGVEYVTDKPYPTQVRDAHVMIDAGADIVIGAHPHVVQPIEIYKDKVIFYSLGNFIFDQYFSPETMTGLAVGMKISKANNGLVEVEYKLIPLDINNQSQPSVATSPKKENLLDHLKKYSQGVPFVADTISFLSSSKKENNKILSNGFHYQLQGATFETLKSQQKKFLVIDPDETILEKEQVDTLKRKENTVLAYVSIGEAEEYRSYWQKSWKVGSPKFLDKENPDWKGNYKVQYWDKNWQDITFRRIDMLVEQGYDGVYLDIIDAYEYYVEKGRDDAKDEMIEFMKQISQRAKLKNKEFLIVPQNAPELFGEQEYARSIDGFGVEDVWFNDDAVQEKDETHTKLQFLKIARESGKFILSVEYPTKNKNICEYYKKCIAEKFLCFVGERELSGNESKICKK